MNSIKTLFFLLATLLMVDAKGMGFTENNGQWPNQVLFAVSTAEGQIFIEKTGYRVHMFDLSGWHHAEPQFIPASDDIRTKGHVFQVKWSACNSSMKAIASKPLPTRYNFFLGNEPENWGRNCQSFQELVLVNIYPGIDLKWTIQQGQVKTEWHLRANANLEQIRWRYSGVDGVTINNNQLIVQTSLGEFKEWMPKSWSIAKGNKRVDQTHNVSLVQKGNEWGWRVKKAIADQWVIDPQLIFSTYSGSTTDNFGYTATYDHDGYLYAGSSAFGQGYPVTLGAYQTTWGGGDGSFTLPGTDIALSKYDISGTYMVWSTFIGGLGDDLPHSLVVNENNELLMYGSSGSLNFPYSPNALDSTFNGGVAFTPQGVGTTYPNGCDIVLSQLNNEGSNLLMSTYYGGQGNDGVNTAGGLKFNYADEFRGEIDLDADGNIYVVGTTQSGNFPMVNATTSGGGMQDAFIMKINSDWQIQYVQKWGGSEDESGCSVAISNGEVWLCGGTQSSDLPVNANAYQTLFGGGVSDGWVAKLNPQGQWTSATYWGSPAYEQWYFIEVDGNGHPFIYGQSTANGNTWVINSIWSQTNSGMVVAQWNQDLSAIVRSTVFGSGSGVPNLSPAAFLVDVCGQIYLSGWGGAVNQGSNAQTGNTQNLWISPDAFQSTTNGSDFYLLLLADDFSQPIYGTYYGGGTSAEHVDGGTSRFDRKGIIYQSVCAGCGNHDDFPIFPPNAVSPINASNNCNNGVFKFDFELPLTYVQPIFPYEVCIGEEVLFAANFQNVANWNWQDLDGNVMSQSSSFTLSFDTPGDYYIEAVGIDSSTCNISDSSGHWIHVHGPQVLQSELTTLCWGDTIWVGLDSAQSNVVYHWTGNAIGIDSLYQTQFFGTEDEILMLTVQGEWCTDTIKFPIDVIHIALTLPSDTALCNAQNIVVQPLSLSDADALSWFWNDPNTASVGQGVSLNWTLNQSGTFYALAQNQSCQVLDSMHWELFSVPSNLLEDDWACGGDTLEIGISNPIGSIQYTWLPSNQIVSDLNAPSVTVVVNEDDVFYVTSSLAECSRVDSIAVGVSLLSQYDVSLSLSDQPIIAGQMVDLLISPSTFDYQVQPTSWIVEESLGVVQGLPGESGWWNVIWNEGQCYRTDSIWIEVVDFSCDDPFLFVPNAFSPNGDGANEVLFVYGHFMSNFVFQINDRWGNQVFYSENPKQGWDGWFNAKPAALGVYHYYLSWQCEDGRTWHKEGNISLIR